jgi:TRAP-type C4-dicarboxylate transport system permease small subunit
MFKTLLGALDGVERLTIRIALVMMFAVMIIVTADVFMRYIFNAPFSWAYDLISLYLMAGIFFLGLSQAYASGAHVSVDILQQMFSPTGKRLAEIITAGVALIAFAAMAKLGFERALDAWQSKDVMAGAIPWPTWPSIALMPLGAGLLCLRLAVTGVGHIASLATGQDLVPLPHGGHGTEEFSE